MKDKFYIILAEICFFIAVFFTELRSALLAIGFLILADTFTGVWGAWLKGTKQEGGSWRKGWVHVQSRKAGRIIQKVVIYPLTIIVAKVAQEYLSPAIPWVDVTAGIIAVIEVKSIFENAGGILGFDFWDRVKKAIWKDKPE